MTKVKAYKESKLNINWDPDQDWWKFGPDLGLKVTVHSNNRNSKLSEVILGSVWLWQSVILRNYDMFTPDSNARYTARC